MKFIVLHSFDVLVHEQTYCTNQNREVYKYDKMAPLLTTPVSSSKLADPLRYN